MNDNGYGLWFLVVFNSELFIVFAVSFFHPRSRRDWRVMGGFSAFVIALFTEMYGYPLTVYLLTGPLSGLVPGVDLSHNAGHLWSDLIGWKGDPHLSPFHLASYMFIGGGLSRPLGASSLPPSASAAWRRREPTLASATRSTSASS
jgi:hypothetical protein